MAGWRRPAATRRIWVGFVAPASLDDAGGLLRVTTSVWTTDRPDEGDRIAEHNDTLAACLMTALPFLRREPETGIDLSDMMTDGPSPSEADNRRRRVRVLSGRTSVGEVRVILYDALMHLHLGPSRLSPTAFRDLIAAVETATGYRPLMPATNRTADAAAIADALCGAAAAGRRKGRTNPLASRAVLLLAIVAVTAALVRLLL